MKAWQPETGHNNLTVAFMQNGQYAVTVPEGSPEGHPDDFIYVAMNNFQPIKGQAREILGAILKSPEVSSCNLKETLALRLACEEIVTNVTSYAYPENSDGFLDVDIQKADRIVIRFEDGGVRL